MRIAFFGLPLAALALQRGGHEVVYAGICRKEAPGTRRLRRVLGSSRVVVRPKVDDARLISRLRALEVDLLVSWFWTTRLPMSLVDCARMGGFGVHPSLLPRWRGPDPCFWAIDTGDRETGVTAHRLADDYDTGHVLGQRALAIDPAWDSWALARALDRPSLALLLEVCAGFATGIAPRETTQDARAVTLAPTPTDDMLEIDWKMSADAIVRRVRSAGPYPGAWTFLGDEAVVITKAARASAPRGLVAGEAAVVESIARVVCADAAVALLAGRRIDDEDREEELDAAGIATIVRAQAVD